NLPVGYYFYSFSHVLTSPLSRLYIYNENSLHVGVGQLACYLRIGHMLVVYLSVDAISREE
ncbi:MAG: hypothetical protein AB2798_00920, partial [Candidatus Thiodiazotropha endolucinida]